MDTGTAVVAIIIILVGILPFILINRKRKKTDRRLLEILSESAKKKQCEITKHEIFNNSAIGIDENANILFYTKQSPEEIVEHHIDLTGIKNCSTVKTNKMITDKDETYKALDKVALRFTSTDNSKPDTIIEFYNASVDGMTLSNEVIIAERWAKLLNNQYNFI